VEECEEHASGDFEGVHFHWIQSDVDASVIESILESGGEPGETPDAGDTEPAPEDEAFEESGCQADCQETYDNFVSMKYSYTWTEETARDGYVVHGTHPEDVPIEVITTDASENGAHASFAGMYSRDISINASIEPQSALTLFAARQAIEEYNPVAAEEESPALEQSLPETIAQNVLKFFTGDDDTLATPEGVAGPDEAGPTRADPAACSLASALATALQSALVGLLICFFNAAISAFNLASAAL